MSTFQSSFQSLLDDAYQALLDTSPTPKIDAELLLQYASNKSLAWLIAHTNDTADTKTLKTFYKFVEKRQAGEPVAYLIGTRSFWTLDLIVTPDVLIPRPDTETLVEQALMLIPSDADWQIADLGTGSGAIALSLAKERPKCKVIATDKSTKALAIAKQNAERNKISNVQFIESDWFSSLQHHSFELIASNPPYIEQHDQHLSQGDLRFEPLSALASGDDGLDDIQLLCQQAPKHLKTNGYLLIEHGYNQQVFVQELLEQSNFEQIQTIKDLNQLPRVTLASIKAL